jgi:hypothetical protein
MSDVELAMVKHADGTPVIRSEAHRSFERFKEAVTAVGGRAPIGDDGQPMMWSEPEGWLERSKFRRTADFVPTGDYRGTTVREHLAFEERGTTVAQHLAHQDRVNHTIESETRRTDREDRELLELLESASPLAKCWARTYQAGVTAFDERTATRDQRIGYQLARRGGVAPPPSDASRRMLVGAKINFALDRFQRGIFAALDRLGSQAANPTLERSARQLWDATYPGQPWPTDPEIRAAVLAVAHQYRAKLAGGSR